MLIPSVRLASRYPWGMKRLGLCLLLVSGGCILPVATSTPQPATTVGAGHIGAALYEEMPTLNLTASNKDASNPDSDIAPAAAATATLSYGLTNDTDLELSAEMSAYLFILPMPVGGSIGLRHHVMGAENYDFGIAGRVGGVAVGYGTNSSDSTDPTSASAVYADVSATLQGVFGPFRPLISVSAMPAKVSRNFGDSQPSESFTGFATNATIGLMFQFGALQLGPYVSATYYSSEQFADGGGGNSGFVSGGFALEIRPDRHASQELPARMTPISYPPPPANYSTPSTPMLPPQPAPAPY